MNVEPIGVLRQRLSGRTQVSLAQELGITTSYLSDILTGRRAIGPQVLKALGLEKRITYHRSSRPNDAK